MSLFSRIISKFDCFQNLKILKTFKATYTIEQNIAVRFDLEDFCL